MLYPRIVTALRNEALSSAYCEEFKPSLLCKSTLYCVIYWMENITRCSIVHINLQIVIQLYKIFLLSTSYFLKNTIKVYTVQTTSIIMSFIYIQLQNTLKFKEV